MKKDQEHKLQILTTHEPRVFLRIVTVMNKRNFFVRSFDSKPLKGGNAQEMTFTICGCAKGLPQIIKQIDKLIDIIQIRMIQDISSRSQALNLEPHVLEVNSKVQWKH